MSCTECGQKLNMTEMYKALCRKLMTLGQDALSLTQMVEDPFRNVQISKSLDFNESAISQKNDLTHHPDQDLLQTLTQPESPTNTQSQKLASV